MSNKVAVGLTPVMSYDGALVRAGLEAVLRPLGGMKAFVSRGDRVLVKPNFLSAKGVETAVCTHPEVITAVVEAVLDAGAAEVLVGDSPALGSAGGVARRLHLRDSLQEAGGKLVDFKDPVQVDSTTAVRFKRFEVERTVLEVDKVINLAKVKTHMQMFLTLAVKNTFGYIVGARKAAWHLEAGRDLDLFATMILDVHHIRKPTLNVLDGIIMMEGNGPGNGTPRQLGLLLASEDAVALDRVTCEVLSLPISQFPTHQIAAANGLGVSDLDEIDILGGPLDNLRIQNVIHPKLVAADYSGAPELLQRLARRLLEVRPQVVAKQCTGCELCMKQCPAEAITMKKGPRDNPVARIDQSSCIHCYCCQEICPSGAIEPRRGIIRRLL